MIVIGDPRWQPGVLGLLAGKLTDVHGCPAFVWGRGEDTSLIKGSCRSPEYINIMELMSQAPIATFHDFGGHKNSGGFSVEPERIHTLEEMLIGAYVALAPSFDIVRGGRLADTELSIESVTHALLREIERLAPFGVENTRPVFLFKNLIVTRSARFGGGRLHLALSFQRRDGSPIRAIGFFMSGSPLSGEKVHIAATIEESLFGRTPELRLRIVDLQMA